MYNGTPLFRTPLGQLVLIKGGVLISGELCTLLYVAGTVHGILITGDILISGVSL